MQARSPAPAAPRSTSQFYAPAPARSRLTIAPTSIINGNVLGTGADTFQLGGTGTGAFNVNNFGAAQQYRGFTTFNKIGTSTWTLSGAGAQNWTVGQGTLIGDTNSLAGARSPTTPRSSTTKPSMARIPG